MNNNNNKLISPPKANNNALVKVVVPNAGYIAENTIKSLPESKTDNKNSNEIIVSESSSALGQTETITITPKAKEKEETDREKNINNLWHIPKNLPKYSPDDIKKLTPKEKKNYDTLKTFASKNGRYIEIKSKQSLYKISVYDFIPLFIGQVYSVIKLFVAYGDAKRTINFNRKLMSDMRSNLIISMVFAFVIWPITIICLFVFYPFMVANTNDFSSSTVTYAWMSLSNNGLAGIPEYFNKAVVPLFEPSRLGITFIVWFGIGMLNIQTFLFYLLFRFNKKQLFKMQKNALRLELQRIKDKIASYKK